MLKFALLLSSFALVSYGLKCDSPKYSTSASSTTDAFFHFHTTYIAEFALQCANNIRDMPVYAVIDGKPYIAAVSEETLRYQLSWTLPNAESSARDFEIAVYDEDGFGEYEKAAQEGRGSSAKPLFTFTHSHPGVNKKLPVSSETVVLALSLVALYFASKFRTELKP